MTIEEIVEVLGEGRIVDLTLNADAFIDVLVDHTWTDLIVLEEELTPLGPSPNPSPTPTPTPNPTPTNFPPENTGIPEILGSIRVGESVSLSDGTWSENNLTYSYRFEKSPNDVDYTVINQSNSLLINDGLQDFYIRGIVTVSDGEFTRSAISNAYLVEGEANTPPVNMDLPDIIGIKRVGETVSLSDGTWNENNLNFTYRFEKSPNGIDYTVINQSNSLLINDGLQDFYIRGIVTVSDGEFTSSAISNAYLVEGEANTPPVNMDLPDIIGIKRVGETVSLSDGTWNEENLFFTYVFEKSQDGQDYTNLSDNKSLFLSHDLENCFIRGIVTADDGEFFTSAVSKAYIVEVLPNTAPENVQLPTISGKAMVGELLTGETGLWIDDYTDPLAYTYTWELADDLLGSNTQLIGNQKTIQVMQADKYVRLKVKARDDEGLESIAYSDYIYIDKIPNQPPENLEIPQIIGDLKEFETLSADLGQWSDDNTDLLTYNYRFEMAEDTSGQGEHVLVSNSDYTITSSDVNYFIRLTVTARDQEGLETSISTGYQEVKAAESPINLELPTIQGQIQENEFVNADPGLWSDAMNFSYRWYMKSDSQAEALLVGSEPLYQIPTSTDISIDNNTYIQLVVIADNGLKTTTVATNWQLIKPWIVDYVALGDSISDGYVHPTLFGELSEIPYVSLLDDYIQERFTEDHAYPDLITDNRSIVGDDTKDLLRRIDENYSDSTVSYDEGMVNAIAEAELITLCIGGNNLLYAAKQNIGYDFDNIDLVKAETGRLRFTSEFPQIIHRIREINPNAQLMVMTIYNPFNVDDPKTLNIPEISSEPCNTHDLVDYYFFRPENDGINDIINQASLDYVVADVFTAFDTAYFPNGSGMNTLTYMYITDTLLGFELRNPHPTALGQEAIEETHKILLEIFE